MVKIGIVGNGKQTEKAVESIAKTKRFEVAGIYEANATQWEEAYFSDDFDRFLNATDAVFFCEDVPQFIPMLEKSIYQIKHVFTDGIKLEDVKRVREWSNLIEEAGIIFHSGNQLSVSPSFLSVWPYLKNCGWMEINIKQSFNNETQFSGTLNQSLELVLKSVKGKIDRIRKNESRLFGFQFPEHFSLWMESTGGTVVKINLNYTRDENEISGSFAANDKIFEIDFLTHNVWELKKNENLSVTPDLFASENELELQDILPQIKKVPRQVIYFDSLHKELLNFNDNITNKLSPLTGINELLEVSILCEKIYPKTSSVQVY